MKYVRSSLEEAIKKQKNKDCYIIFDTCSSIFSDYPKKAKTFLHTVFAELREFKGNGLFLMVKDASHEEFLAQMIQYSDQYYEV